MSQTTADRRQQILDAAVEVFAARGHADTRIQDVADAAGVAYGLVYHYFGTKDRLLQAVFDANWATFADVVEGIVASNRAPSDQIRAVVDYAFGALEAYPARMKVILLEYGRLARVGEALAHDDVSRVLAGLARCFAGAAERGELAPGADPDALPILLLGALQTAVVASLDPSDAEARRTARLTILTLFRGVLRAAA